MSLATLDNYHRYFIYLFVSITRLVLEFGTCEKYDAPAKTFNHMDISQAK